MPWHPPCVLCTTPRPLAQKALRVKRPESGTRQHLLDLHILCTAVPYSSQYSYRRGSASRLVARRQIELPPGSPLCGTHGGSELLLS